MDDHVSWDKVVVDGEAFWGRDALRREEYRGPETHGFVDYGIEEGKRALTVIVCCVFAVFFADGVHVRGVHGELHENEG